MLLKNACGAMFAALLALGGTVWIEDRPVMLFDDWAASQDPAFQQYFLTTLLPELKARGKIIIYASRDETAQPQADQVLHLQAGRLLA